VPELQSRDIDKLNKEIKCWPRRSIRRRQMVGGTATFTDPGDYQASVAGASINLVLTGGGNFDGG